jgi:hypothetical protein
LPQPDSPSRAKVSPAKWSKEMPSTARQHGWRPAGGEAEVQER